MRTNLNLVAVGMVSAVLCVYAVSRLVATVVLDRSYRLTVQLPTVAGLRENTEVSYNGHPIGRVEAVELTSGGARATLAVEDGERVPHELDVVVLRRSAIGEYALDLRPISPVTEATTYYADGDEVTYRELTLPPEMRELFETVAGVFEPLDEHAAGRLVGELADVVRGRSDDVRSTLRHSADFAESVADNGDSYDRFFSSARVVDARLAQSRETVGGLIGELRDATSVLTDLRGDLERLLVEAPPTLTLAGDLVERGQADLSCSIASTADLAQMTAKPRNLHNVAEALRNNRFFFVAFEDLTQLDHRGRNWARVLLTPPGGPPPTSYLPDKRPYRDVLPGGPCDSPFGAGAEAATQAGFGLLSPHENEVVRPADDRRDPGRATRSDRRDGGSAPGPAAVAPPAPLPATGAAVLPLLTAAIAALAVGAGLSRSARRRSGGGR